MFAAAWLCRYISSLPLSARASIDNLVLGAGASYVFNAMNSQPQEKSWDRLLTTTILPSKEFQLMGQEERHLEALWMPWGHPTELVPFWSR